jgi:hypothetical protein
MYLKYLLITLGEYPSCMAALMYLAFLGYPQVVEGSENPAHYTAQRHLSLLQTSALQIGAFFFLA